MKYLLFIIDLLIIYLVMEAPAFSDGDFSIGFFVIVFIIAGIVILFNATILGVYRLLRYKRL